jgi:hypothetical protein
MINPDNEDHPTRFITEQSAEEKKVAVAHPKKRRHYGA